MLRRLLASAGVVVAALLAIAGPVSAHIDPDPAQARAGSRVTVGFTVEHGCEGSPTTQLDMRLPEGVADPVPEAVDGWDGSVDTVDGDTIITFVGGPLADDVDGAFEVTMTLPPTPDTTIYFPFVQRCEFGEIRWIGIPAEPGDELDEPAPAMELTGPVTTEPTVPAVPAVSVPTATTATAPTATAVSTQPSAETSATPSTSEPVLISPGVDEGANSDTGTRAFIVSVAAVLALGGFVAYRARQARAEIARDDS